MTNSLLLPFFAQGVVVKGFGRGSKDLGIPTANFSHEVVETLPDLLETGVYYGWASIDGGPVYKMVLSVGWNPHFNNTAKTMETHVLHKFEKDFYGSLLKVAILGFIRPMRSWPSLDELITAIQNDISFAEKRLDEPDATKVQQHSFFTA